MSRLPLELPPDFCGDGPRPIPVRSFQVIGDAASVSLGKGLVQLRNHLHRRDLDFESDDCGEQPLDIARRRHSGLPNGIGTNFGILRLDLRRQIIDEPAKKVDIIDDFSDSADLDLLVIIGGRAGLVRSPVW
jgi:hypothetical protein